MRIEQEKVGELIEILKKRDERERGMQPLLALGCFYDLDVRDDSFCLSCANYESCRPYLKAFEEKEILFGRK